MDNLRIEDNVAGPGGPGSGLSGPGGLSGSNSADRGHDRGQEPGGPGGPIHRLWMTRKEACETLGVSSRTLTRLVTRGDIVRQRIGRESRYRTLGTGAIDRGQEPKPGPQVASVAPIGGPSHGPGGSNGNDVIAEPEPDFLGVIERMADKIGTLERERAEAIAAGHQLADERDELAGDKARMMELLTQAHAALTQSNNDVRRLHSAVDSLTDAVAAVCSSPLAAPVRRRLRAALAPA